MEDSKRPANVSEPFGGTRLPLSELWALGSRIWGLGVWGLGIWFSRLLGVTCTASVVKAEGTRPAMKSP